MQGFITLRTHQMIIIKQKTS